MHQRIGWLAAVAVLVPLFAAADAPAPTRPQLEQIYKEYQAALKAGDLEQVKGLMSSHAFASRHNSLASMGMAMDAAALERAGQDSTHLADQRFITLLHQGPTAALVYVADFTEMNFGDTPYVRFFMAKFVHEEGSWKVDDSVGNIVEKFKEDGTERTFADLDPDPEFAIDGTIKPAPQLLPRADYGAIINVQSQGCRTRVQINGVELDPVENGSFAGTLPGGLKKGQNPVRIIATPLEEGGTLEITVDTYKPDAEPKRVFSYSPEQPHEGEYTAVIEVE